MIFKETTVFTRQISNLISDDAYREFQQELIFNPIAGDLIKGKRWSSQDSLAFCNRREAWRNQGYIYYWQVADSEIFLLLAYGKTEKEDLSAKEIKILKALVEENMR